MTEEHLQNVFFKPPAKLLIVDDSHLNRSFITNAFGPPNYEVSTAVDGAEGITIAKKSLPELILLDIMMPGMDGFETAKHLKSDPDTASIPIIFITALDAIQEKLKAFEVGAVDFVTKPFNHKELMARVRTNIELRRIIGQRENMFRIAMEEKRNAAIARIAAGVSHNFNNMLGVSFGNIMLVESLISNTLQPMAKDALGDVKKSLGRMQVLVKQFLLLANRSSEARGGNPAPLVIQIRPLVEEVVSNLSSQKSNANTPMNVNCVIEIDPELKFCCDASHFREIINLILNEVVEISVGKAQTTISAAMESAGTVFSTIHVKGIPHSGDIEDSIFEPFALPIANVGSGLSFSVAKNLIELNGGTIKAAFPSQNEIVFKMSFPMACRL
ncbi:MAG: hypothetical protein A2X49_10105 [Lentisphaerae bacterium GWF2_52_8]|nr:MAG: hypothetical protein A2X49_10105 [Lentisphaerae bacterium GWF2_52_8]